MPSPFDAVTFNHGPVMKNRFMLSPLTNQQSNPDGTLSDDEERWLTMRAAGGFGMTMTCASHVDALGQDHARQEEVSIWRKAGGIASNFTACDSSTAVCFADRKPRLPAPVRHPAAGSCC